MFFVGAIGLTALVAVALPVVAGERVGDRGRAAGLWTLAGLAVAGIVALALFVGPEWSEYRFYNWQMSVTRKPSYDAQSLLNRVSWFPVLHDVLSRMWVVVGARPGRVRRARAGLVPAPAGRAVCWCSGSASASSSCCCTTSATSAASCS